MAEARGHAQAQVMLHWITVALLAGQYAFHDGVAEAFDAGLEAGRMTLTAGAALNMAGGMAIIGITIYRLFLRQSHGVPSAPTG